MAICARAPFTVSKEINTSSEKIQLPEVQELVLIIFSLTENGQNDSNTFDLSSAYYKEVQEQFSRFKKEHIVECLNKKFDHQYNQIRMDACNYQFTDENKLAKKTSINNLSWGNKDHLTKYIHELEKFAIKSNFRKFYNAHRELYNSLIQKTQILSNPTNQVEWLEDAFSKKYNNYNIFISPLSWGRHSTKNYSINDSPEFSIFISAPPPSFDTTESYTRMIFGRLIFTEIDHNFVNPVSDTLTEQIKEAFSRRLYWTEGKYTAYYKSEYSVFNEYMTWALFLIYANEHYDKTTYLRAKGSIEEQMIYNRGFVRFKEFSDKLLELNQENPNNIPQLFAPMLFWCKELQSSK